MADDLKPHAIESTFLVFTSEETGIADAASDFLGHLMPIERLHGADCCDLTTAARGELGAMGWFGLAVAEAAGGSGLSAVEHALFFRALGRRCGPLDALAQVLAVLSAAGDADLQAALMTGEQGVALAMPDGAGLRVLGAPDAGLAVLAERDGARLLDLSTMTLEPRASLDPSTTMRVCPDADGRVVAAVAGSEVWDMGQLGAAAMLVGVAEAALEQIVDYAGIRETFGRKIGAYQAVRHPCADMALRAEAARCQLWYAAASIKEGKADAPVQLDAAKHLANQAAVANADVNIQLHGGIGITEEHNAHLFLKRALLLGHVFGKKRALLSRLLHATVQD
jgi:alkylation response protein AidB-like acyl-CoA dehydrogenase